MPLTYEISLAGPQVYETAALMLAAMVRPGDDEEIQSDRLYQSLCTVILREHCRQRPDWGNRPQRVIPGF